MKTIEEIVTNKGLAFDYGYNLEVVPLEDVREYMRLYAEQALDEAADKAQEMNYERGEKREIDGFSFRTCQIVYATPKQSILSIKEQLK